VSSASALPRPPRQRRSRESSERVIKAGLELLDELEYDSFTIAEVSRRAGVSVGSIYARFGSKDDLFLVLHDRAMEEVEREHRAAFDAIAWAELDDRESIRRAVHALTDVFRRHASMLRVFMLRGALDPLVLARGSAAVREVQSAFAAGVLTHRAAVRHPDPELALDVFFRMAFAVLARRIVYGPAHESGRPLSWDELSDEVAELCAAYLLD
jgi:AcrR family transcriptional regulator